MQLKSHDFKDLKDVNIKINGLSFASIENGFNKLNENEKILNFL